MSLYPCGHNFCFSEMAERYIEDSQAFLLNEKTFTFLVAETHTSSRGYVYGGVHIS